jgi:hypothetical protein
MNQYYRFSVTIDKIAREIESTFDEYQNFLYRSGYLDRIRTSYQRYYNLDQEGAYRVEKSEDGSITRVTVNHFKNLVKRLHILVTQSKLAFLARARNSDTKSQMEADLAKGILEYYGDEKALNGILSKAVEVALVCMEAFLHTPWNLNKGYELTADEEGRTIRTGDQDFEVFTCLDVARNLQVADTDYYIVRSRQNKWDLAALHPEFADAICASTVYQGTLDQYRLRPIIAHEESDLVDVFILYHRDTPALPDGRYTVVCNGQVLADGVLGYKRPPVFRLSAGDVIDTIYGDSPALDLLSLQEVINALTTAVVSNNMNHAQQNIWSPDPNLSVKQLAHGQNLVTSSVKPEALQLTASAGETYKLIDNLSNQMQLLSGLNATARGQPEASLKSGNSLALMLAQAIQFVSDLQKNYQQLASDVGTCIVNNMQRFAKGPMLVTIGGSSRKSYTREFQRHEIMNIDRVSVDLGNPLGQTVAGRYEMVQGWRQSGSITPRQEIEFLKTGQIDSLIEDEFRDAILVREENDELKAGRNPPVLMTDDHRYHVIEHNKLLSDPEAREDLQLIKAVTHHMQEHIMAEQSMDPALRAMLTGQPLPQAAPAAPAPGAQPPPEAQPTQIGQGEANLPNVPPGTPPEVEANYQQAIGPQQ